MPLMNRPRWLLKRELWQLRVRRGLLLLLHPGIELRLRDCLDGNRHAAVILAADLVALPVEYARLRRLDPGLNGPAGNGVTLQAQRRDEEAVDHVRAVGQDADLLADRNDHLVVDR